MVQVLLVTGGWDGGEGGWWNENNYYTSTEVTLQNHMRKLNFGKIGNICSNLVRIGKRSRLKDLNIISFEIDEQS